MTLRTSASSCTSPKAPRDFLSPSSSCKLTTLPVRLSIFFCASSMVARRCITLTKSLVGLLEALVQALAHLAADLLQALVNLSREQLGGRRQLLRHGFAALAETLRQRELERMHRIARLPQLFADGTAQALRRIGLGCADALALAVRPSCRSVSMARCFSSSPCAIPAGSSSSLRFMAARRQASQSAIRSSRTQRPTRISSMDQSIAEAAVSHAHGKMHHDSP